MHLHRQFAKKIQPLTKKFTLDHLIHELHLTRIHKVTNVDY